MHECSTCFRTFSSVWAKHAHQRYHQPTGVRKVEDNPGEEYVYWDDINDNDLVPSLDEVLPEHSHGDFEYHFGELRAECLKYLDIQRQTLSPMLVNTLEAGFPMLLNKTRKAKADIRTYFEVVNLVLSIRSISLPEINGLIRCLRVITKLNGKEIPMPARYTTILNNLMRETKPIKSRILKKEFTLSKEIFGERVLAHLPVQHGVINDIVKVISKY